MTLQVDFWQLVLLLLSFFGACAGAGSLLLRQTQKHLDEQHAQTSRRLDGIEATSREEAAQWQRVERELLTLKAELPLHYVRREDYIRGQTVLEAKMDMVGAKVDSINLRAMRPPAME